ncbi:SDR family oxidoreductase [Mycobacterium montefiorense]|uniref:3-oxoacyl-[acyl-carrier-protein] reductase MabA n=1 Tax=Mycobacterium montefiorense TaxID=154654 RepID=A0AA37UTR0_9MYCO|nr:SDR family NAD(P)-dependent oxidoreductase [Mycobacterium montefiorense]GBG38904.1 short-chain dehydrogenase [Mycobacterium montefiorense]GKU32692.1 short-chain dehydrogenase [Mycobacterium montefiorense]GKU38214.1 short-chain dehydrogenase [Mycobacterium montefiorense]GKU43502.1 short-chain dehydrogenase [Mycobacterium montefiorense]GKU50243.1 short-chain dehydrogenase [Mycobacterium montefiorense]
MTKRTALVTGANGGIGSAVCDQLRAADVTVRTMDVAGPADVVMDLSADPIPADAVRDVDICVSVAGVVDTYAPAHSMSAEKWSRDIDVNLTGSFRAIQACLPGMRERRFGRIVAISSMAAQLGSPGKVAYAASKAGLYGMVRTIAIENCALGITANCVLPGMIATPPVLALPEADQERIRAAVASGRFGRPEEVADLVAFLVRDASGYITAQEIGIDGGLQLNPLYVGPSRAGRAGE